MVDVKQILNKTEESLHESERDQVESQRRYDRAKRAYESRIEGIIVEGFDN